MAQATKGKARRDEAQMKRGLPRYYQKLDQIQTMRKGFLKEKDVAMWLMFGIVERYVKEVIATTENDGPQVATWYGNAPEIPAAMGILQVGPAEMMLQHDASSVELSHHTTTPEMTCGLLRIGQAVVAEGLTPTPTCVLTMLEPCDGQTTLAEMWQKTPEWADLPYFALDAPYGNTEEDYWYFVGELKRMIAFLEEHTGKKMDYVKLKRVCEEGNKQYALWNEICELQGAVPAPMPSFSIAGALPALTQHLFIGDVRTTWFLRLFAQVMRGNVKKGVGAVPNEKIRCIWLDIPYSEGDAYGEWLAETYGAIVCNSTWGEGHHYTPIDTSSPDSMLYGIAKRSLADASMIRDSRSTVDQFLEDVKYMVKHYKADCVIYPGHKGHKDMYASVGFLRDVCRELGVPLLALTTDVTDPTWKGLDEVKRATAEFFEAQGWEPINQ